MILSLIFVFQENTSEIKEQQFKMNCPYPVFSGSVSNLNVVGVQLTYSVNSSSAFANQVVKFVCFKDTITQQLSAFIITYTPTDSYFPTFDNAFAWIGYTYTAIQAFFDKASAFISLVYLFSQGPAEITGISELSYALLGFAVLSAIGLVLAIRG